MLRMFATIQNIKSHKSTAIELYGRCELHTKIEKFFGFRFYMYVFRLFLCSFICEHVHEIVYEPEIVDLYPAPNRIYCQQPLNWNHDG